MKRYRENNRGKLKAMLRKYYLANKERMNEMGRKWRIDNLEKEKEMNKRWRENNKERKEATRSAWMRKNPHLVIASSVRRRKALLQAIPKWADESKMADFYAKATELTIQTGIKHNVDHIVPIQSKIVCGLHAEHNLQILPKRENIRKGNRWWPDMPVAA